jgi:hypothetical protein
VSDLRAIINMQNNEEYLKKLAKNFIEKIEWSKDDGWGYVFYCKRSKKKLSRAEFYEDRKAAMVAAADILFENMVLK